MEHGGVGDDWSSVGRLLLCCQAAQLPPPFFVLSIDVNCQDRDQGNGKEKGRTHTYLLYKTAIVNAEHDGVIQILGY